MKVFKRLDDWCLYRKSLGSLNTIGFVPTMGALHVGHEALMKKAIDENDISIVSIFVNPLQFNDSSDYEQYPNTLDADITMLEKLGVDALILPNEQEMYAQENKYMIAAEHPYLDIFEGAHRPGHFKGVLTIVLKLLNLVSAGNAYFGEKDYQQYRLIKAMAEDLFLKTNIVACETIRENSGLPYSSRNKLLSKDEHLLAEQVSKMIQQVNSQTILSIKQKLLKLGIKMDYLEIKDNRVFSAIKINAIRLIDNFSLMGADQC